MNQCDGCRAGRPLTDAGYHKMSDGPYPDFMACERRRYEAMIEDPSGFTVKLTHLTNKYRESIAPMYGTDHARAKRILFLIADLCSRAEVLHDALEAKAKGDHVMYLRLVTVANAGFDEEAYKC